MIQHPNYIIVSLLHKQDELRRRDAELFNRHLTEGPTVIRLDLMLDFLNAAEEVERSMMRRDAP